MSQLITSCRSIKGMVYPYTNNQCMRKVQELFSYLQYRMIHILEPLQSQLGSYGGHVALSSEAATQLNPLFNYDHLSDGCETFREYGSTVGFMFSMF